MACRIGITTNLSDRKRYWQSEHPNLRNWKNLKTFQSKSAAQNFETRMAGETGCTSAPGGDGPERGTWYVYRFEY